MKRKMTSKEELERVRNGSFVDCKECYSQWCIGCLCCRNKLSKSKELDIIEKDLDRLEKLEKENQELKEKVNHFEKVIEVMKNPSKLDCTHMFDNCKELKPLTERRRKTMNSVEALQDIRDYHNETVIDNYCTYTENMFEKELDIIEKDLEILKILKNNLYEEKGTGRFKGCNTINCSLGNQHSGIDYTKVKEWLE